MIRIDVGLEKQVKRGLPSDQLVEALQQVGQTVWMDLQDPVEADWKLLSDTFHFHTLAMEDARKQNQRPKIDPYDGYLFLTLRTWRDIQTATDDLTEVTSEVDVFLGPNYLVTLHRGLCAPTEHARVRWEQRSEWMPNQSGFLLYLLLDNVVDSFFPAMDILDKEIDILETAIYAQGTAIDILPALALRKRLLLLRQTIAPLRDMLSQLMRTGEPLIANNTRVYYQDVIDHTTRLVEQIDLHREIVNGILDAIMAQTNNRLNQVVKTLTGISTVLMSAALIATVSTMNYSDTLNTHSPRGFWIVLTCMALVSIGLWSYFRRIKWF